MKVLHVIPWISRKQGGPSRSSQGLVAAQCAAGIDAWLQPLEPSEEPWIEGVRYLNREITIEVVKEFDLVHIHEIWNLKLHKIAAMCRKAKVPYVIAPRGMLEPWSLKQKWLKKRVARFLYQDRDLKKAAALHATADSEKEQFREIGLKNYCIVSPNGVNLPSKKIEVKGQVQVEQRRALFVSRMHAKKGVLELVEAWAKVKPEGWVCELVYTNNGAEELAYEARVKTRVAELGLSDQFIFTGSLDDVKKWEAYGRADLFVLPTYSENFGIVVAEALWAGLPVITTKGTPWSDLISHNCGWWVDTGVDALTDCLRYSFNTPASTLKAMGANGHALVEQKYTWPAVAETMLAAYSRIVNEDF